MKVLFIGDPHLKINRFDLAKQFLSWLDDLIAKEKPDIVVNLGDTFDTHAVVRSEVMVEFMNHVFKTIKSGAEYVYLLGNHDMYKPNDPKYHALKPFKGIVPKFHVIDETIDMFGMTFVPYQHNGDNFPKQTLPICIAHQTFLGADYGPIVATEGVDAERIAGCEIIISGHIHKRSVLGKVVYVGSPFSQSASDIDQIKGITLFETDTYNVRFAQTPLPTWRRFCGLVSEHQKIDAVHAILEQDIKGSKDHWVLELEGPKAEIVGYLGSTQYKEAIDGVDVKVKTTFTDKEKKKVSIEAKSMDHIISEYVSKVYNGSIDKKELLKAAQNTLIESRQSK